MSFGLKSINKRTPTWVKNTVAISMIVLGTLNGWVYATKLIPDDHKQEVMLGVTTMMGLITALAPLFGVKSTNRKTT